MRSRVYNKQDDEQGYPKNDRAGIGADEVAMLKTAAKLVLDLPDEAMSKEVESAACER